MTGQAAHDVEVRLADASSADGYTNLAALRMRDLSLYGQNVDSTHIDSVGGWRDRLVGVGWKRALLRGSGVFKRYATDQLLRQLFLTAHIAELQLILPGVGTLIGPMQITALSWAGGPTDELAYAITLESAGPLDVDVATLTETGENDA